MKAWDDLVAAALLGTARAALPDPPANGALPGLLRQLDQAPERRLLGAAALLSLYRQAGARPQTAPAALPPPAPDAERPACPAQAGRHLEEILRGEMGALLEEWLGALAATGRVLPPRWLPELLDLAATRPALRPLLAPVLGERGRWLAAQNPQWEALVTPAEPAAAAEAWQTGTREARRALLLELRSTDPARARELLASTWAEETPADRAAFIATLATGLGPDDEALLEAALDDRRKEVRVAAAGLLARLPGSQLCARMQARLQPLLSLERGLLGRERLQVALPEAFDRAMARDGLVQSPPPGLGERAWWLLQMLAAVPPAAWSQRWAKAPEEIVRLAAKDEQRPALLTGLSQAAARHRDGAWAQALLEDWLAAPWQPARAWHTPALAVDLEGLVSACPAGWLDPWLAGQLRAARAALQDGHPLLALLDRHRRPWSEELTRALLGALGHLAARPVHETGLWRARLPAFACCACADLAAEAERTCPTSGPWAREVDRFLAILRFRRDMRQALC